MRYNRFYTPVDVKPFVQKCDFSHSFGFIGSCFSDEMYSKFRRYGFTAWQSPFGTTYNPLSILHQIDILLDINIQLRYDQQDEIFFSWETSHTLLAETQETLSHKLQEKRLAFREALLKTDVLYLTVGSSWAYFLEGDAWPVANCHKMPSSMFHKRLLTLEEMHSNFERVQRKLQECNPYLQVVLTVSPVRHVREGLIDNNRSKARLIEWCHTLVAQHAHVHYFPAYELVVDELRDYRFYAPDGAHPNTQAIEFVWQQLQTAYFTDPIVTVLPKIEAVRKLEEHKVLNAIELPKIQNQIFEKKQALEAWGINW